MLCIKHEILKLITIPQYLSICCFQGFCILTDGLKMTENFSIQNHWRLAFNLLLKVEEKKQKKWPNITTLCVFLLHQEVNGTHSTYKVFIGVKKFDRNLIIVSPDKVGDT